MKNLLYIILTTAITSPALAQTQDMPVSNNDGTGYIGASILLNSKYLGSADEEVRALPYLSFDNVKGFTLFGTTLRYRSIDIGTGQGLDKWSLRAGPSISYQGGRDSDESVNLNGFDDIGGSAPLGGFILSTIGPVGLGVNVGKDIIGGHDGLTADASIGTFFPLGKLKVQPTATVSWADNKHNDSFFTVTDAQAATSGLTAYDAGSGIYAYSAGLVSWVEIEEKYAVSLIANYRWFTGDAADSPILNSSDGSKNGIFATIGVSRKFDTAKW
ncbi:MipA/OmpV family protein [Hellea balneolensis]|uniref:MipA/OmpV family protein n=1 Tax=Hellea balneolensis TaxID=287478 RepID=UPI000479136A|nr:MipA/OmpV family protein [Hellea balneolensis]